MKYAKVKDDLVRIFKKAVDTLPKKVYQEIDGRFIIYRGYKISMYDETSYVEILNVRSSDFYKFISNEELLNFIEYGFEKACDLYQIQRDDRRLDLITDRIKTCIENNDVQKWNDLKRDRRIIVRRMLNIKKKWEDLS